MTDRRYSDDEVAAIFARATEVQEKEPKAIARHEGMSLAELQSIGREAGISPEMVAQAARELDQPAPPPMPTLLGMPIGVAHTVQLPRELSDREWEQLVVRLRETFNASGKVSSHGSFRQWSNGNLQVLVEPSGNGHRVRFRTMKGDSRALVSTGIAMTAIAGVMVIVGYFTGGEVLGRALETFTSVGFVGAGLTGAGLFRLRGWGRRRQEQMLQLGAELLRVTSGEDGSR